MEAQVETITPKLADHWTIEELLAMKLARLRDLAKQEGVAIYLPGTKRTRKKKDVLAGELFDRLAPPPGGDGQALLHDDDGHLVEVKRPITDVQADQVLDLVVEGHRRAAEDAEGTLAGRVDDYMLPEGLHYESTNLVIPPGISFQAWQGIVRFLVVVHAGAPWWIGASINYGEKHFSHKYAQAIEETGLKYSTLATYALVDRAVPPENRRDPDTSNLTFSHHVEVAGLPPTKQNQLLDEADQHKMPTKRLRERVQEEKRQAVFDDCAFCGQRCEVLDAAPDKVFDPRLEAYRIATGLLMEAQAHAIITVNYQGNGGDLQGMVSDQLAMIVHDLKRLSSKRFKPS